MNSGKSLAILTKDFMLRERGFKTCLMKPAVDDRTDGISTRLGISAECHIINKDDLPSQIVLQANSSKVDYLLIDEAQFLYERQVLDLCNLVDNWGINVYCYGLKLTWQGDFFEGSAELMKHADELIQVETFCKYNSGSPAMYHIKHGGSLDDGPVETGYEETYESVSRKKWFDWNKNRR